jgi:hypothetical protein
VRGSPEQSVDLRSKTGSFGRVTSQFYITVGAPPALRDDANRSRVLRAHARTARLRGYQGTSSEFVGVTT